MPKIVVKNPKLLLQIADYFHSEHSKLAKRYLYSLMTFITQLVIIILVLA